MKTGIQLLTIALLTLLLATCEKPERDNPWDEKNTLNPEAWAPQNFLIEDVTITEKKLSWTYEGDDRIEGFKLDRKKGDEPWQVAYQVFGKEVRSWNDTEIIPDTALNYSYRLYVYAGKNNSGEKSASIAVDFPPPTDLQVEKLSDISYKLTWQDNSTGEEGFKIDRKTAENEWVIGYGTVAGNTTAFVDTNVFVGKSSMNVEYRVYAYYGSSYSANINTAVEALLTAPSNLQLEKLTDVSYKLTWLDNSIGEEGFQIDRKTGNDNWTIAFGTVAANVTTFVDTNVFLASKSLSVSYRVYGYVSDQFSDKLEISANAELIPPTSLQIIQNTITKVTLNWQDNSTGEEGFKIERRYSGDTWGQLSTLTNNTYSDETFELNAVVYYRVSAYSGQHQSGSAESNFNSAIPAPMNLTMTVHSPTSVTLSWAYSQSGHQGFKIDRKINEGEWQNEFATIAAGQNNYTDNSINLENSTYRYRIYSFIEDKFSDKVETLLSMPTVTTGSVTNITGNSATGGGNVSDDGGSLVTQRGVCWSTSPNPTTANQKTIDGNGTGNFTSNLTNLSNGTTYYVRAYATNQAGTAYGNQTQFTTLTVPCHPFTDNRDGNYYTTVQIGTQCWMKENLKWLPNVSPSANGSNTSPYYYVYDYQGTSVSAAKATANYQTYGVLYNWPAALNACPEGWHLPTDNEWTVLTDYLGGSSVAGGKMKTTGTTHWQSPNTGATNSSGFSGLPGGYRNGNGNFYSLGSYGYWWSSTEGSSTDAWYRTLSYDNASAYRNSYNKERGRSVRCVRD
jgi:uncharacterized protein (TIGR02145 family)